MDSVTRFKVIELAVGGRDPLPTWEDLGGRLDMPDDRWRELDPTLELEAFREELRASKLFEQPAACLWLGVETADQLTRLDAVLYGELDATNFPSKMLKAGPDLVSNALTTFERIARAEDDVYEAYSYGAVLAWTGLMARLLEIPVTTLAGFGGGDYLVLAPAE